jgi:16S rRNA (uracil1498-N3)-methyltransferase
MDAQLHKFPRLLVPNDLSTGTTLILSESHAHYLKTVLRREPGAKIRLFNGRDGEWLAAIEPSGKSSVSAALEEQVKLQPMRARRVHLLFPPLKKDRLDILIEKAVELDVTDFHPIITDRTDVREIKIDRMIAQIIEAAEQCERLNIPTLHPLSKLEKVIAGWRDGPIFAGLERSDARPLQLSEKSNCAALIGPAVGWTNSERELLQTNPNIVAVSLGTNILRAETAAIVMLAKLIYS